MVVNSCLENLEGIMRLKTWREEVDKACRGQRVQGQNGGRSRQRQVATCLRWKNDRRIDLASTREIPIFLNTLFSTASSGAGYGTGVPIQRREQYSIKLQKKAL